MFKTKNKMNKIIEKEFLTDNTVKFVLEATQIATEAKAGQFVFINLTENDRLTLSLADTDKSAGTITVVVEAVGEMSEKLASLNAGDEVHSIEGPKGKEIVVSNYGKVLAVAGGAGIAPMLMTVKELKAAGNKVYTVLVAKTEEQLFFEPEIGAVSEDLFVFTYDNGDEKGLNELIKKIITSEQLNQAFLTGPKVLLANANDAVKSSGIDTQTTLW